MPEYFTLRDRTTGRIVAAGSYDALRAAARLIYGSPDIVNPLERDIMNAITENVKQDMDAEWQAELARSA